MIETTPNARTRDAYRAAHVARSEIFTGLFRVFRSARMH